MAMLQRLLAGLEQGPACLVEVESTEGSAPRGAGTWMAVFAQQVVGTIGGGQLEYSAIEEARRCLEQAASAADLNTEPQRLRYPLGPRLGQCCGGVVYLRFTPVVAAQRAALTARLQPHWLPVALFGGGHVGHALVRALAPLPFAVTWIDSRGEVFAADVLDLAVCEYSEPVQAAVPQLAAGSLVLIMSFSHAEDLEVVIACLKRQREQGDLPFVGLIGSHTKWATFRRRLRDRGFSEAEMAHITCPIGLPGIGGKEPEVIAVAVAAQLLQLRTACKADLD